MPRTPIRTLLLASAAALSLPVVAAQAQSVSNIPSGGSSLAAVDYAGPLAPTNAIPTAPSEFYTWNSTTGAGYTPPDQLQYYIASSGRGQNAFATDNPTNFIYTGTTPLGKYVAFAASDAFLASSGTTFPQTINGFTYTSPTAVTYPLLSTQDGALIQLPMLGLGITIPAASGNPAVKGNGTLKLTDADLCGIFSDTITTWDKISHPLAGLTGQINVYFRADASGTSFLTTNHLKYACVTGGGAPIGFTAAQLALMPTFTFASLFTTVPSTFHAETGSPGVAEFLAGTVTTSGGSTVENPGDPQGIGYLSTDFTDISTTGGLNANAATSPDAGFVNTRALYASAIEANGATKFLTPTIGNIGTGLSHAGAHATHPKPPAGAARKNPLNWVPSIPLVKSGYPIVGYTNLILAQCYNTSTHNGETDTNVASGLRSFLAAHYAGSPAYAKTVHDNGFTIPGTTIATAITNAFLTSGSSLEIADASTAGTCANVSGR